MQRFRTFPDFSSFNYVATFDGAEYRLRFTYQKRSEGWYLDLMEPDGTPILMGSRVVISWPLFWGHYGASLPEGLMMALDLDGEGIELTTQDELGGNVRVVFVPPDEMDWEESTADSLVIAKVP